MSICKGCGAEIQWVITRTGKKMPLDAKVRRFYVITNGVPVQMQGQEPHFGTCPKADRFKKKKEAPAVKDLGWANSWGPQMPEIVKKCRELGHKPSDKSDAPGVPYKCHNHTVRCDICGYFYKYDSS